MNRYRKRAEERSEGRYFRVLGPGESVTRQPTEKEPSPPPAGSRNVSEEDLVYDILCENCQKVVAVFKMSCRKGHLLCEDCYEQSYRKCPVFEEGEKSECGQKVYAIKQRMVRSDIMRLLKKKGVRISKGDEVRLLKDAEEQAPEDAEVQPPKEAEVQPPKDAEEQAPKDAEVQPPKDATEQPSTDDAPPPSNPPVKAKGSGNSLSLEEAIVYLLEDRNMPILHRGEGHVLLRYDKATSVTHPIIQSASALIAARRKRTHCLLMGKDFRRMDGTIKFLRLWFLNINLSLREDEVPDFFVKGDLCVFSDPESEEQRVAYEFTDVIAVKAGSVEAKLVYKKRCPPSFLSGYFVDINLQTLTSLTVHREGKRYIHLAFSLRAKRVRMDDDDDDDDDLDYEEGDYEFEERAEAEYYGQGDEEISINGEEENTED